MNGLQWVFAGFCLALLTSNASSESARLSQRVLYIGHRFESFEPLLKEHFTKVESVAREKFEPTQARDFDVVVLDWPQSHERAGAWVNADCA